MRDSPRKRRVAVEYDIILSPTYQVPVLYFYLLHNECKGSEGLNFIYNLLVPAQYKSEIKDVGVMGGISATVCLNICPLHAARRLGGHS